MNEVVDVLTVATVVGSGVVTGILLIFSNTVMPSLARHSEGAATMVTINERILNPGFLLLFMGTTLACGALGVLTLVGHGGGGLFTLLGCALYIVGVFGVTAAFNVPMNDRLAEMPKGSAERAEYWRHYLERWTRWNTVRSILGIAGTTLLATGMLAPSAEARATATLPATPGAGPQISQGSGTFAFSPDPTGRRQAIDVFYHRPAAFAPEPPILLVVPGAGRNADDPRAHLDEARLDFDPNRRQESWIFADFDRLFEVVASAVGSRRESYDAFGHSAGGQILHRMAILLETALPFGVGGTGLDVGHDYRKMSAAAAAYLYGR